MATGGIVLVAVIVGAFAVVAFLRPNLGRVFFGALFAGAAVFNMLTGTFNWMLYRQMLRHPLLPEYQDITFNLGGGLQAVVMGVALLQGVCAALVLGGRDRQVTWGLLGMLLFTLAVVPVGPETLVNAILAAALASLLARQHPHIVRQLYRAWRGLPPL